MNEHSTKPLIHRFVRWVRESLEALRSGVHPKVEREIDEAIGQLKLETLQYTDFKNKELVKNLEDEKKNADERLLALSLRLDDVEEANRHIDEKVDLGIRRLLSERKQIVRPLLSTQISVEPSKIQYIQLQKLDAGLWRNVRIKGQITVSGGAGNDINFAVVDERNFNKFKSGQPYTSLEYYGKVSSIGFEVPITHSGNYYLLLDNTFSWISQKTVSIMASLEFEGLPISMN